MVVCSSCCRLAACEPWTVIGLFRLDLVSLGNVWLVKAGLRYGKEIGRDRGAPSAQEQVAWL